MNVPEIRAATRLRKEIFICCPTCQCADHEITALFDGEGNSFGPLLCRHCGSEFCGRVSCSSEVFISNIRPAPAPSAPNKIDGNPEGAATVPMTTADEFLSTAEDEIMKVLVRLNRQLESLHLVLASVDVDPKLFGRPAVSIRIQGKR